MHYKRMTHADYKKLSDAQRKVLGKMEKGNLIMGCSEGANYSARLESRDGERIENINRATGNVLFSSGAVRTIDRYKPNSRNHLYVLSPRYLELSR